MRRLAAALALCLAATQAVAAEVRTFNVRGSAGYQGTVVVTPLPTSETATLYMAVEWNFAGYLIKGYGVVAKDEPSLMTVSFVAPAGLGVGRYKLASDGSSATGTLVGDKGIFVQEVWTATGAADDPGDNVKRQ